MLKVVDIDKGWRKMVKGLDEFQSNDVFVGIHEGKEREFSDDDGEEAEEYSSAEIAAIHEFGSEDGTIPERSFLRASTEYHEREISAAFSKAFISITTSRSESAKKELNRIGLLGQAKVRNYIAVIGQGVWPDISEATKKSKGSESILIDTTQLMRDINYTVEANPDAEHIRLGGV